MNLLINGSLRRALQGKMINNCFFKEDLSFRVRTC
jgi:hypothetical protein